MTAQHSTKRLAVLDLFSGIGGFSLGLERTGGFETKAFCEIDPFCRRVLAKHWPDVPQYDDVRTLTADALHRDGIAVDVICGGFPCQDISYAGKRAGLEGARSGLWAEYARLIGELRPGFVIVENTPGLLSLGMGDVLGDLVSLGYDALWDSIPACSLGANHVRDRVWIIAYPNSHGLQKRVNVARVSGETTSGIDARRWHLRTTSPDAPANANGRQQSLESPPRRTRGLDEPVSRHGDWETPHQPVLDGSADGLPNRLDRNRSLGNAVVPQIPEIIGRAILASMTPLPSERRNEKECAPWVK